MDDAKLGELMATMAGYMVGAGVCLGVWLGDELGLYRSLAGAGATSADELASATECHPRLVREWLDGQAAARLVDYDSIEDRYTLTDEAAMALADDTSPVFLARGMNAFGSMYIDMPKIASAFKGDGGLSWGDHHPCLFAGTEWMFRTGYRALLTSTWIPALDGVQARLDEGASVADIGCGHGASIIVMAEAFPNSRFFGFDFHEPSIQMSRERAAAAGVADRTVFEVADAKGYSGAFDLVCFFDCLHDMGDPVGIARYAREHLTPGGSVLLVEPFALDDRATNIAENPMAPLVYMASTGVCTPNSLSQEVGLGLGAQAGAARLRAVFDEAGYSSLTKVAETRMNLVLQAKP